MRSFLFLVTILFFISACKHKQTFAEKKKELDAGQLNEKNIYTVKEVGWTVEIPGGWEVLTREENAANMEKGKKAIEENTGKQIDASNLVDLINFKKDPFNSFLSTMELFNEADFGSYEKQSAAVHEMLKQTYAAKNIYAEYELGATRINGLMFDRFITKIFAPDKKKIIMTQEMYSSLINNYDFAMTINYNNEKDQETLMKVINSSKFSGISTQ